MSLKATSDQIIINNALGIEKFNSSNKLLYTRYLQYGSISFASGLMDQEQYITLTGGFNPNNDLPLIFVYLTSANGNVSSQILNSWIQLNFSFLTNFAHSSTAAAVTAWDMLNASVLGDASNPTLKFDFQGKSSGFSGSTSSSIAFDWKLVMLSYR